MNSIGILSCGSIYSSVNRVWYHSSLSDIYIKGDYKKVKVWWHRTELFNWHQAYFKISVCTEPIRKEIRQPALILRKCFDRQQNMLAGGLGLRTGDRINLMGKKLHIFHKNSIKNINRLSVIITIVVKCRKKSFLFYVRHIVISYI